MKKIFAIILAFAMIFSLAACGGKEESSDEKVITVGADMTNLTTLDVWESDYNIVLQTSDAVFDRLFDKNKDTMELELNLLAEWPTISEDGRTYTFKLRDDVVWSDGEPLTAKDVEFTFNYFYKQETASENTWVGEAILGCIEMETGEADVLEGFKLIDDYTFEMTLYESYTPFLSTLATSYYPILPAHLRTEAGDEWGHTVLPVGSGPWKFTYFDAGVKVEMVPNENYRGNKPQADKLVIMNMDKSTALLEFEAGHIDFCSLGTDQIEDAQNRLGDKVHSNKVVGSARINLNMKEGPLADVRVRKAFGMAMDLDAIIDGYYKGTAQRLYGVLPEGIPGYDPTIEPIPYDPEGAKALLAEAGYADGFELEVVIRESDEEFAYVFQIIQEQVAKVGIILDIVKVDTPTYNERLNNNEIQVCLRGLYADYMDSYMYLYNFISTTSFNRSISLADDYVDQAMYDEVHIPGEESAKIAAEVDRYLCNEIYACIPVCQYKKYWLCSDRVKGLFIKSDNLFNYADLSVVE